MTNPALLGGRLKAARKKQGMTLQELAERTGLTAGLLSKIENFRALPSLPVLFSIAAALHLEPGELFDSAVPPAPAAAPRRRWRLVRAAEAVSVQREENRGFAYRLILEGPLHGDRMELMLVSVEPGAERGAVSGEGVELIYMLAGRLDYYLEGERVELNPGDTLYFDSSLAHYPENRDAATAVMLLVYFLREPEEFTL